MTAGALLLTGCASAQTPNTPAAPSASRPAHMSAGMVMPDGSTMSPATSQAAPSTAGNPSSAEKMICGAETHATITKILGLAAAPISTATWRDHLYTCTYHLPVGTLIVSVKQSANPSAANTYFGHHRSTLGPTETLYGLGQRSYGTTTGTVVLIKDHDVLTVDATRLPAVFGKQGSKRFDFAYELASAILGCWTEG